MPRKHVLALIPLPPVTREALNAQYELHVLPQGIDATSHAVPWESIAGVVTNGTTGLSQAQMERLPALQIVSAYGVGYENVDTTAAAERGIVVTNAPGTNDSTVADHALGFMLALSRGYATLTQAVRAGDWERQRVARPTLTGATVGIIGMGRIGQGIAQRCAAFGMQVIYCTRNARADLPYAHEANLIELAHKADYLVAACPGGAATRHIVNREVLQALGSHGFLVNVARGSVVHTDDLITALQQGVIAGAGLDVLESEPEVPQALRALDNVIITPHMAGRSPAAQRAQTEALLDSLSECFAGQKPKLAV